LHVNEKIIPNRPIVNSSPKSQTKPRASHAVGSTPKRPSEPEVPSWKDLCQSLSELGFKRGYLRDTVLPSWWEPEVVKTRNGFLETAMLVHRRTGLPLAPLFAGRAEPASAKSNVRFKKSKGVTEDAVRTAHLIARQVAETVAASTQLPFKGELPSAAELHSLLKDRGRQPWVALDDLLDYCREIGIPVVHTSQFPAGARKPDGMAVCSQEGRPVIVLCKASQRPAWMVFILAHELGHIVLGHVPEGGAVVDGNLEAASGEEEERQANEFASVLLTGKPDLGLSSHGPMKAGTLARAAQDFARRYRVSPGVAALNWGFNTGNWPVANGAVKILEGNQNALEMIQRSTASGLDWDSVSEDAAEWLESMAGIRQPK
jgi:Zn-dependent peptidase ImmA (M78 family)